jgi:hypothetical protein
MLLCLLEAILFSSCLKSSFSLFPQTSVSEDDVVSTILLHPGGFHTKVHFIGVAFKIFSLLPLLSHVATSSREISLKTGEKFFSFSKQYKNCKEALVEFQIVKSNGYYHRTPKQIIRLSRLYKNRKSTVP